jgi:hypothetical protein
MHFVSWALPEIVCSLFSSIALPADQMQGQAIAGNWSSILDCLIHFYVASISSSIGHVGQACHSFLIGTSSTFLNQ